MSRDRCPNTSDRKARILDLCCGKRHILKLVVNLLQKRLETNSIPVLSTRQLAGSLVEMLP